MTHGAIRVQIIELMIRQNGALVIVEVAADALGIRGNKIVRVAGRAVMIVMRSSEREEVVES